MSASDDLQDVAEGLQLLLQAREKLAKFRAIRFIAIATTQIDIAIQMVRGYIRGEEK